LFALLNKSEIEQRKLLNPELEKTDRTEEKKEKIKVKNRLKRKAERNNSGMITNKNEGE
jgi:hypothetical protein